MRKESQAPQSPPSPPSDFELTFEQMDELFKGGLVGTKEFRNWLGRKDTDFASVRDADVDNEIDRVARYRADQLREQLASGEFGAAKQDAPE